MKKLSFYEQVGILIPGAVLLFGAMFYVPELRNLLGNAGGISIGGLGVYVLIAYASGHAVAALGNLIENIWWLRRGMPSGWVVGSAPRLLSTPQLAKLDGQVKARLGISIASLASITPADWFPIARQIYADVDRYGKTARVETFNGNYGLNRGLSAALTALAGLNLISSPAQWVVSLALIGLAGVYLYRMHRFGVHYARELYNQFLLLPSEPGKPTKAKSKPRPKDA